MHVDAVNYMRIIRSLTWDPERKRFLLPKGLQLGIWYRALTISKLFRLQGCISSTSKDLTKIYFQVLVTDLNMTNVHAKVDNYYT